MSGAALTEVVIVSLGSTAGLRAADEELRASLERAGASATVLRAHAPRPVRTLMLTDLAWARAARAQARRALSGNERAQPPRFTQPPRVIYSTTTAALLWPLPGAIRFDAPAAENRPGRHGLWQRPLERRRLREAPLLLPWSAASLSGLPSGVATDGRALVIPVPVEPSAPGASPTPAAERDIAALTYAANPRKKGLDRVLAAWDRVRSELPQLGGEELVVAGASQRELNEAGFLGGEEGVRVVGALQSGDYRALLRRTRVFVCAPRREDYGIAQLEALADGCALVTTPSPGPYAALAIARTLDPRLVADDLAVALRAAFEAPSSESAQYAARARDALAPFTREAVDAVVARELLPRLAAGAALA